MGGGQSHRIPLGPREGWVSSLPPFSPHLSQTSTPPLPGFSEVPTLKRDTSKPRGPSPHQEPLQAALGTEASLPPPPLHQMWLQGRVSTGSSWQWPLGGPLPAESADSVPAARPPHSALPPTHFPERLGLPFPILHKHYARPFPNCPPRCQGLGPAISDHGGGGGCPALPSVRGRGQGR